MRICATEFDLEPQTSGEFVALVSTWIKGMRASTVFNTPEHFDRDPEAPVIEGSAGDVLSVREVTDTTQNLHAMGFRYDYPDEDLIWRTEGVLLQHNNAPSGTFRVRVLCEAASGFAPLHNPNKPFIVKSMIREGLVKPDGDLTIREKPHHLPDSAVGLALAKKIVEGSATQRLPIVYVSTLTGTECALNDIQIKHLAQTLGGVAHVVCEPNRRSSFQLKEQVEGRNAYGGAVGIAVPGRGVVSLKFRGWNIRGDQELLSNLELAATQLRSQMASAGGWDWGQLQEMRTRQARLRERARLSETETEQLWQEELEAKDDRIRDLKEQVRALQDVAPEATTDGLLDDNFVRSLGPEIYPGEFSDRTLSAITHTLGRAEAIGLDPRSIATFDAITRQAEYSGRARVISAELSKAIKDKNRLAANITRLMTKYGFEEKSDNKHIRMAPCAGFAGLETITIPKTPSETRGQKNLKSQIEAALGLQTVKKGA